MAMRWPFVPRSEVEKIPAQSAYELWAPGYPPRPHNALMELEHQHVLALLPDVRGLTALDACCGTGRYLRALLDRGAKAIGMDLSPAMLARAKEASARISRADVRALPFDAKSIDLVVCGLALGDFSEIDLALAEIARVLRPGGQVIYSVVHPAGEAEGWSRTFESDGRQLAIESFWHSLDRHRQACAAAGFTIDQWREPALVDGRRAVLVVRAGVEAGL